MTLQEKRIQEYDPKQPDHSHRILTIGGSGSGKVHALLHLINHQPDSNKLYPYPKDSFEEKYQLLIDKCKNVSLKHFADPEAFIKYLTDMNGIFENIDECSQIKE